MHTHKVRPVYDRARIGKQGKILCELVTVKGEDGANDATGISPGRLRRLMILQPGDLPYAGTGMIPGSRATDRTTAGSARPYLLPVGRRYSFAPRGSVGAMCKQTRRFTP